VKRLPTSGPLELTDADMTGRRPGAWSPSGTAAAFTRPPRPTWAPRYGCDGV